METTSQDNSERTILLPHCEFALWIYWWIKTTESQHIRAIKVSTDHTSWSLLWHNCCINITHFNFVCLSAAALTRTLFSIPCPPVLAGLLTITAFSGLTDTPSHTRPLLWCFWSHTTSKIYVLVNICLPTEKNNTDLVLLICCGQ